MDRSRSSLLIAVIVIFLGVGLYRMAVLGKLPVKFNPLKSGTGTTQSSTQTNTVVLEENAVISAVEKSSPSVVAIGIAQRAINPFNPFSAPNSGNTNNTIGTGFAVSDSGIIVTNRHVVSDLGTKYSVITKDGKKLEVTKIYRDPNLDLALVQINGSIPKQLELGDSSKIKVGQTAIAIGNALGRFDNTVTTGIVSGLGRAVSAGDPFSGETEQLDNLIQTDAAINPGNSGGPLLNSAGQVVGVNVATTEGAQNIGFAIPINSVKALVDEFVKNGTISRAYLGVRYRVISRDVALLNEVPQGAYVQEVLQGSPAEKANIQPGDIITKIDGSLVSTDKTISDIVQKKKAGENVSLEIWTDGKTRTVNATLAESPNQ